MNNSRATTVTLSTGKTTFFAHVAAQDGYSTNIGDVATAGGFEVRRDADVRLNAITITWQGGRIELDREDLGLNPDTDGETGENQGPTTLNYTVPTSASVPASIAIEPEAVNDDYGEAIFYETLTDTDVGTGGNGEFDQCSDAASITSSANTLALEANANAANGGKGEAAICIKIVDSDNANPAAADADSHADNMFIYRLILTRQ